MEPSDTAHPDYFHRVVDCQWACPAHTNVPEYIRLIAQGQYTEAYMVNRESNVFPGILGRTCDRPCEPACRRDRLALDPVAAAGGLAGTVAGAAQDPREDIGLPVDHVGVGVAALGDEPDVLGNVGVRRTGPLAVNDAVKVIGVCGVGRLHLQRRLSPIPNASVPRPCACGDCGAPGPPIHRPAAAATTRIC